MNIISLSTKRPVSTLMVYAAIILLGIISLYKIPKALFPKINYPRLTISTSYLSAAPAETESLITIPLEEAISTISGIKNISSVSKEGLSIIYADFAWGTDINSAVLDVRQKIDLIKEKFPEDADSPIIKKINPFSLPMMVISFAATENKEKTLFYINKFIKDKINKTNGVALTEIIGDREKEIFVDIDANRLKAHSLDTQSVCLSLKNTNLDYPAGNAKSEYYDYIIRTEGRFKSLDDIADTLIFINQNRSEKKSLIDTVKLKDIASVYEDYPELKTISRLNQQPVITLQIYKQSDANTIETAEKVKETLKNLNILKQKNITYQIVYDKSEFIQSAYSGAKYAALFGALLAFFALLFFLRSAMAASVAFIAIPVSVLACFIFMFFSGISLNLMSLSGIALSIGMLVDNAVVVIENIKRHTEKNRSIKTINKATAEVTFALLAATLTTISVFMPLLFLKGLLGEMFSGLSLVVTFALIISLIVSITLIPRLYLNVKKIKCDNYLRKYKKPTSALTLKYKDLLTKSLNNPKKLFTATLTLLLISFTILFFLPKQIMPEINEGDFMIKVDMPPATNISYTNEQVMKIEKLLSKEKNIKSLSTKIGSDTEKESSLISLTPSQAEITVKTKKLTEKYFNNLYKKTKKVLFDETKIKFIKISPLKDISGQASDIKISITSFSNQKDLLKTARKIITKIETADFVADLTTNMPELAPENRIKIDKAKAALRGINSDYISATIYTALKGRVATELSREDKKIPIRVRLQEKDRLDLNKIKNLPLKINDKDNVFLKDVSSFHKDKSPSSILRLNGLKTIEIDIALNTDTSVKTATMTLKEILAKISKPENIDITLIPKNTTHKEAFANLIFMFSLALFLIYMIMAAQFESFLNPLLIMLTVPLSIIGVAFGLFLFGKSLNIISILGIIMLCGIAVNNGIILIEYIELQLKLCETKKDAIIKACVMRFRPILITATTTVLGLLPMMVSSSQGAAIRSTLAVTLSFGLLASTGLILFVLPVVYLKYTPDDNLK